MERPRFTIPTLETLEKRVIARLSFLSDEYDYEINIERVVYGAGFANAETSNLREYLFTLLTCGDWFVVEYARQLDAYCAQPKEEWD